MSYPGPLYPCSQCSKIMNSITSRPNTIFETNEKNKRQICMYVYRFQNVFPRCPTPRLHCFLSSHWPSFRYLSFMAFLIPSILFLFGLPRAVFCFGIHFNAILGNLPSAIQTSKLWVRIDLPLLVTYCLYWFSQKPEPSLINFCWSFSSNLIPKTKDKLKG